MSKKKLDNVVALLPSARTAFENQVGRAAFKATKIAKQISPAIGEISIVEAKAAIIREFCRELGVEVNNE